MKNRSRSSTATLKRRIDIHIYTLAHTHGFYCLRRKMGRSDPAMKLETNNHPREKGGYVTNRRTRNPGASTTYKANLTHSEKSHIEQNITNSLIRRVQGEMFKPLTSTDQAQKSQRES